MDRFVKTLQVRFNEVDKAGIVFYPRFFDYFHITFEDFWGAATDVPYPVWINDRRIGWPTVHTETDFRSPLRYGDRFDVSMGVSKVGRSSFVARYELTCGTRLCAKASITSVTTDLERLVSIEMPPAVRAALERYRVNE